MSTKIQDLVVEDNTTECIKNPVMEAEDNIDTDSDTDSDTVTETEKECDNVNELSQLFDPLSFTKNSDLYVVSVNGIPQFYVRDAKTASEKMWDSARILSGKEFFTGYRTNYLQVSETELHLLGSYRFFLIAYDTVLHRISYSKVQECV